EFTSQLDNVIDCIKNKRIENVCDFSEAIKTDRIMADIRQDAVRALQEPDDGALNSPLLAKTGKKLSLWEKLRKFGERKNA
ncbi:MAG: hypothetical protein QGH93_00020, partial [Gammaproteobacteria bacterium]|nr:hypothetical protein [Gammaproteobacteria bacterium]